MGRPAVVPPAGRGEGGWMRAPVGALGGRWGAFFESAEGGAAGSEIGALPGGRRGVCGPRGLVPYREVGGPGGPRRRVRVGDAGSGDAGLQGDVAGWWCAVGPVPSPGGQRLPVWLDQRAAWNSSRLGVRTARRSNSLSVVSLPMALTRSRTDSGTWSNRVSRTSIIASRAFWTRPFSRPS